MDNDILVLISMLPGIESAIESLTKERDIILGRLGMKDGKRKYIRKAELTKITVPEVEIIEKKKTIRTEGKRKCPVCGKFFVSRGLASHVRSVHKTEYKKMYPKKEVE